jgi:hypothetical protein
VAGESSSRLETLHLVEVESTGAVENVGAPTFKVLLEGYIKDIVPVLPWRLTGLRANLLKCRWFARNTGLR